MMNAYDDTIAFGEEDNVKYNTLTHPYVVLFHLAFRLSAVFVYLFGSWFSSSFIGLFVTIVLLLSCDFWTVKNITGRILVGLRWWNYIDDAGNSHWKYESRKGLWQNRVNAYEAKIFWTALIGISTLWSIFFIIALLGFNFKWLLIVSIALVLNYANLFGYIKCKFGQSSDNASIGSKISTITSDFIRKQVFQNMMSQTMDTPVPEPTSIV